MVIILFGPSFSLFQFQQQDLYVVLFRIIPWRLQKFLEGMLNFLSHENAIKSGRKNLLEKLDLVCWKLHIGFYRVDSRIY